MTKGGQRKQGSYFTMMTSQSQANRRRDTWTGHLVSESSEGEVIIDTVHTWTCDRCCLWAEMGAWWFLLAFRQTGIWFCLSESLSVTMTVQRGMTVSEASASSCGCGEGVQECGFFISWIIAVSFLQHLPLSLSLSIHDFKGALLQFCPRNLASST